MYFGRPSSKLCAVDGWENGYWEAQVLSQWLYLKVTMGISKPRFPGVPCSCESIFTSASSLWAFPPRGGLYL